MTSRPNNATTAALPSPLINLRVLLRRLLRETGMGELLPLLPRNLITFFRWTRNYRSSPPPDVFNLLCRGLPAAPLRRQIRWSLMAKHGAEILQTEEKEAQFLCGAQTHFLFGNSLSKHPLLVSSLPQKTLDFLCTVIIIKVASS